MSATNAEQDNDKGRGQLRLGFLASHGGSNLQAILDAIGAGRLSARPVVVISNNSGSMALRRAEQAGIRGLHLSSHTHRSEEELDRAICGALGDVDVQLVVLAGYMKKIGPRTLETFAGRIVNIHPSLLPRHGGKGLYGSRVHESVLASGDAVTGVSVHIVDAQYDRGPILGQCEVPVEQGDTAETLAARVLKIEHRFYSEVLDRIARGDISLTAK